MEFMAASPGSATITAEALPEYAETYEAFSLTVVVSP